MQYKIWSTYPPVLSQTPNGGVKVYGGTITKLQAGTSTIPIDTMLPASTTLSQFEWQRPTPTIFQPVVRTVQGSKGDTYTIKSTPSGKWECSCSGYTFRRTCKHIKGA
jgi:hypothetical protein